jgi:hypothetical protein
MSRDRGDPQFPRPLPIGIDRRGKAPRRENLPRLIPRQADGLGDRHELIHQRDVPPLDEKRPVDRPPERVSLSPLLRPFAQFLGPPAVVGAGPFRQRQPLGGGQLAQPRLHGLDVFLPPAEEFGQLKPFCDFSRPFPHLSA